MFAQLTQIFILRISAGVNILQVTFFLVILVYKEKQHYLAAGQRG